MTDMAGVSLLARVDPNIRTPKKAARASTPLSAEPHGRPPARCLLNEKTIKRSITEHHKARHYAISCTHRANARICLCQIPLNVFHTPSHKEEYLHT